MDPKIGSPNDNSPERLAAIDSHCTGTHKVRTSAGAHEPLSTPIQSTSNDMSGTYPHTFALFRSCNGPHLLKTFIAPLFATWNMNSTFGVCLLYEAIELPPDSKVLFKGDWLTAWSQGQTQSPDDTDQINEVAWKLVDGQWKAVEYTDERTALSGRGLGDTSGGNGTEMQDFLDALSDLLFEHDLQDILGLRALPEKDFRWWVELPMGETAWRVMSDDGKPGEWESEECAWFFHGGDVHQSRTCRRHVNIPKYAGLMEGDSD